MTLTQAASFFPLTIHHSRLVDFGRIIAAPGEGNMNKSLALLAAVLALAGAAHAQPYPAKAVRIIAGFAPGGSTDLTARIFAQELNKLWNAQVVVDNRPGASGMIGAELAAK